MKVILFANTDWYLYNFRRSLALALMGEGHDVLLVSPQGPYTAKIRELGLRWRPVPMRRRSLNPFRELMLLWHLVQMMREERPTLVHSFTIKPAIYGSLAARIVGVPARVNAVAGMGYVFTSGDVLARALRPLVRGLFRFALGGHRARLVLQNPDDVAVFQGAGIVAAERTRLIMGSGVDCSRFCVRGEPRTRGGILRVLLAARLLWDKGLREYADAARMLRKQGRNIAFLLAGEPDAGNPAAVPMEAVQNWVREGSIEWLGHVDAMDQLFASVDVVVLPSYREGLPKGLIEAAACALPLVTTDVPGCREVVANEVDGLLVPPRDSEALAGAIARLHDDPDLASRLGQAARRKVLARFEEKTIIAQTIAVYREIVAFT